MTNHYTIDTPDGTKLFVPKADYDALNRDCDGYIEDRDTAYARIRELEAALLQYGYHDVTCHYLRETLMCTCGFESLRAALAPQEPT